MTITFGFFNSGVMDCLALTQIKWYYKIDGKIKRLPMSEAVSTQ